MNEKILDQLKNVPYDGKYAFEELKALTNEFADLNKVSYAERLRLNYELNLIKKWGIAKVFLFGYELCNNEGFGTTYGVEGNSFVNYLLGISNVNPVKYNLPFERFFNEYRKFLPNYNAITTKGEKGKILKALYEKYGKNCVIKSKEDNDNYFVLVKPINPELIKESRIVARLNEESYQEIVSVLSYMELMKLGYYNFSINEVKGLECSLEERFSEKALYERAKIDYFYNRPETQAFTDIEEVKDILVNTDYKLIYQEQLIEILNKLCGFAVQKADHLRREIAKAKKESLGELKKILLEKYGENGKKLFTYLFEQGRYTVSKACVLANLHNLIEY